MSMMQALLFDFHPASRLDNWFVVDDGVMGGLSQGRFFINEEGHGEFSGEVSLENNGGFSSVRYRFEALDVSSYKQIHLRIRGDGKRYQVRAKTNAADRHSYVSYFETSGEWQTIAFELNDLKPTFRGNRLNMPNFPGKQLEEIGFLIGNKTAEPFRLEIDWIGLQ